MSFVQADSFSVNLFLIFSVFMFLVCLTSLRKIKKGPFWTLAFLLLTAIISGVSFFGVIQENFIPLGPLLILLTFIYSFAFAFSKSGMELTSKLSLTVLIGFQAFRFPLEIILHHWFERGTIPETMTWTGQNWDIATGVLALISFPFVGKIRSLAVFVNTIGFILLLNVLRVVAFSSPLPFAWDIQPKLLLLAYFPYALIVPLFVMPAFIGHLLTFKKLHQN